MLSSEIFYKIKEHKIFKFLVILAILISSILAGASTFELKKNFFISLFQYIDFIISSFFLIEIIIRLIAEKNKINFFRSGWNIFDSVIVVVSIVPIGPGSSILLLRLVRIFRILRLIEAAPELRYLIEALISSFKKAAYILLLLFIVLYMYGTFGSILFSEVEPEKWEDITVSIHTLVQVLLLSGYETIFYPLQEIYWWAWIFFYSFIALGSVIIINLVVAVLVDFMISKSQEKKINK